MVVSVLSPSIVICLLSHRRSSTTRSHAMPDLSNITTLQEATQLFENAYPFSLSASVDAS